MKRRRAAGEGNIGCILWTIAFLILILICYKIIPIKLNTAEMYDFMIEQAKFGTAPSAELKKIILGKAKELEIPINDKNLSVERIGDRIRMKTAFEIPVDFPGYTYVWKFDWEIDRPIYII